MRELAARAVRAGAPLRRPASGPTRTRSRGARPRLRRPAARGEPHERAAPRVIRVAVAGAAGRMGQAVCAAVEAAPDMELVGRADPGSTSTLEQVLAATPRWSSTSPGPTRRSRTRCACMRGRRPRRDRHDRLRPGAARRGRPADGARTANVFIAPNFAIGAVLMMRFAAEAAAPHGAGGDHRAASRRQARRAERHRGAHGRADGRRERPGARRRSTPCACPGLVANQEVIFGDLGQTLTIRHDTIGRESFMPGVLLAVRRVADAAAAAARRPREPALLSGRIARGILAANEPSWGQSSRRSSRRSTPTATSTKRRSWRSCSHLAANGSDGFVVAGTTGEASTLTEGEQLGLIELAVAERPAGKSIIAGTGTNDTRQAVHLTERATELGADAMLSVTPYYNRPSRLRPDRATTKRSRRRPTNRRSSTTSRAARPPTCRPTCSPSSPRSTASARSSRPTQMSCSRSTGSTSTRATTPPSRARSTWAAPGGILVASHIVGNEMQRMVDEPERRAEIDASLQDVYETLFLTSNPTCTKAALNMLGHEVGGLRLPLVEATDEELTRSRHADAMLRAATACWRALARRPTLQAARPAPRGLGEIGKNMTVVEQDGRIIVVDVGLRFPTPEMVGIDLVLPGLRLSARARARTSRRSSSPTGTRTTSARCRGSCASSATDAPPPVYAGALTIAMARSKLDEHKLSDVELNEIEPGEVLDARTVHASSWST